MKVLVVDDDTRFLKRVVKELIDGGLDAVGIYPDVWREYDDGKHVHTWMKCDGLGFAKLTEKKALVIAEKAEVILLDHDLGYSADGQSVMEYWKRKGIKIDKKRMWGISGNPGSQSDYIEIFGMSVSCTSIAKRLNPSFKF